jgi:nitrate reductase cytochrome c-type subunit
MNHSNLAAGIAPAVIDPAIMNGNGANGNGTTEKKNGKNGKEAKVTLDKNGKPKRKKASRGIPPLRPFGAGSRKIDADCVACQSCQKAHLTCDDGAWPF